MTFKILTANITKNQNLKKTFKDPYLFDKDGGVLARLYDILAKFHGVSNCVPPSVAHNYNFVIFVILAIFCNICK